MTRPDSHRQPIRHCDVDMGVGRFAAGYHDGTRHTTVWEGDHTEQPRTPSSRELRAWANTAGIPCAQRGILPRRVVDAWHQAHRSQP